MSQKDASPEAPLTDADSNNRLNIAARPIATLWVKGPLGWLERLCLDSFVKQGHVVDLYTYDDTLVAVPGVTVRDASEVLPYDHIAKLKRLMGSFAAGADIFRYELMRQRRGMWVDADVICLRPFMFDTPVVLGYINDDTQRVANGVVYFEADSPVVREVLEAYYAGTIPTWLRLRRRAYLYARKAMFMSADQRHMAHNTYGPDAMSGLRVKHRYTQYIQPAEVFFPLDYSQSPQAFDGTLGLADILTSKSLSVHWWNNLNQGEKHRDLPDGSMLKQLGRAVYDDIWPPGVPEGFSHA